MTDIITTYKNYLNCLLWIKEFNNKYDEEDVLPIFEEELKKERYHNE